MRVTTILSVLSSVVGVVCSQGIHHASSSPSTTSPASSMTHFNCTAVFTPISASAAIAALNPGWNLGNTLDATPDEGSWNNPRVVPSTFSALKSEGFNSVRIPVTWTYHFITDSPSWTVNSTWMDRVETVVDQALATGLYVVLNVHHDATAWADVTSNGANYTMIEEKFGRLWHQIGSRMRCKSSKLLLEPINEPPGTTQDHANEINKLNSIFLQSLNEAGGYNPQRVVTLVGMKMDAALTSQYFVRPKNYTSQPWAIQFHYYSPYQFIFNAWGDTIWGSDDDKAALTADFQQFHGNFTDVPTLIGEWQATPVWTETAARWKYTDYFVRTAKSFNFSHQLWDNGLDFLSRANNTWDDPTLMNILFKGTSGQTNSLPDSSSDYMATSWNSSAYLFHRVGETVTAQSVNYLLNGNTLKDIKTSSDSPLSTSDYTMSSTGTLTLASTYLSTLFNNSSSSSSPSSSSSTGIKETLALTFSSGSPLTLQIIQYSTPTLSTSTSTFPKPPANATSDLVIPISYQGLPQIAAIKALNKDGSYMNSGDAWTMYKGPLQQARWTYGDWSSGVDGLHINANGQKIIGGTGQDVILSLEFYPRSVGANTLNITFT